MNPEQEYEKIVGTSIYNWVSDEETGESELSEFQRKTALKEHPSFLEIAAFSFFPGSFLVGPQFSMRRYQDYVHGRLIESKPVSNIQKLPDCIIPGILRTSLGFIYVGIYHLGSQYFPEKYLLSHAFDKLNFVQRCFVIGIWGRINLYKYISCWLMTEGVCTAFGLTYNGKDSKGLSKWDGCANVKLLTFENATEYDHYIQSFNINTNHWSAEYIYKRLKFLGSKLYSQVTTLAFLAVWHGFHSGYYMCFVMEFIIMYFEKDEALLCSNTVNLAERNIQVPPDFFGQSPCDFPVWRRPCLLLVDSRCGPKANCKETSEESLWELLETSLV
ncbi:lysophospholipid acyltransferase 5-like [Belonocnema kinseyi]|uniref:lysophospholipid acyltransferase 5-like n=1 Tax=Belonocnema kinseyi TaxID=2817044 RepID=UPI00143D70DE|nr:lysophospholipid acyltransferase 5-like [Belonocnema kinseyi]